MTKDQSALLARVRRARAELEEQQDAVEEARAAYVEAVRRLYDSGLPLREIANELGLSHQRVHQMVTERDPRSRTSAKKVAKGVAGIAIVIAVAIAAIQLARADGGPVPSPGRAPLAKAAADEDAAPALVVRGLIAKRHPRLKRLLNEEVTFTGVSQEGRLRVEWGAACLSFSDWLRLGANEWMLTGPPKPC